ncbi:MAG: helix-turn-helix domain-containing protein [Actinomycetota bacterium]|nr:helix-turn-helix domain-containing protein [Actinomycetota bacterium]
MSSNGHQPLPLRQARGDDGGAADGDSTIATAQGDPIRALTLLVVDVRQAAQLLQCSRSLLYELIRAGELPTVKIGRLTRIKVSALHGFVERGGLSRDPLVRGSPRGLLGERGGRPLASERRAP